MGTAGTPTRRNTKTAISLLFVVGLVVGALLLVRCDENAKTAEQLARDLRRRTGSAANEGAYDLAQTLVAEGVSHEDAVDVAGTLSYLDGAPLDYLDEARLLARFEQQSLDDDSMSRRLVMAAEQMGVDSDGLRGFLNLVAQESTDRQMPVDPLVAGLLEHGFDYATGCELVEQAPCPPEVVVQLVVHSQDVVPA